MYFFPNFLVIYPVLPIDTTKLFCSILILNSDSIPFTKSSFPFSILFPNTKMDIPASLYFLHNSDLVLEFSIPFGKGLNNSLLSFIFLGAYISLVERQL